MVRDYTGIARALMSEWDKTSQPLKERATVLPFGQYEDGSVGLAWPGLLAAPVEGMQNFGRYGYDTPEAIRDNARSAFDVAGGAVTGGLGVGLAGGLADNAVGIAGGKLAGNALERAGADLPMDLASRMARAREMGFDTETPLYHGTRADHFDEFIPSQRGVYGPGVYASDRPAVANSFATDQDGGNVLPLFARGKFASMADLQFAEDLAKSQGFGGNKKQARAAEILKERGFSGVKDEEYSVIFDPRNIRSVNAAFDPSKSDSANLLAANAKSGAAVPLAGETQDTENPLLQYLRMMGNY